MGLEVGAPDLQVRRARFMLAGIGVLVVFLLAGGAWGAYALFAGSSSARQGAGELGAGGPDPAGVRSSAASAGDRARPTMTPEKADKLILEAPTGQKDGVSTGFAHTSRGAVSAAVYFWEEFAFLDDHKARQQLAAVTSAGSADLIDAWISKVRTSREAAGLPPSGGTPAGITFSTSVNAACPRTLDEEGDVIEVWLDFDRYATQADGGSDDSPLRGESVDLVLTWRGGAWRLTEAPQDAGRRLFPVAYYPTSPYAWQDGWVQVRHGG
jgi:hypothetical protein